MWAALAVGMIVGGILMVIGVFIGAAIFANGVEASQS